MDSAPETRSRGRRLGRFLLAWTLPALVLAAGVAFSLHLHSKIEANVFYSGDGGLKALLARQLGDGRLALDLARPAGPWVVRLGDAGLYPLEPPWAYHIRGRRYIQYGFPFLAASAPFHALLGFWGLHVLPLASTWALWLLFARRCRSLGLR